MEFRHESWFDEETFDTLRDKSCGDAADADDSMDAYLVKRQLGYVVVYDARFTIRKFSRSGLKSSKP